MANEQDLAIWEKRWVALGSTIEAVSDKLKNQDSARATTLYHLLKCLRAFTQSQFNFFSEGFDDDVERCMLEESRDYPLEYIFRVTLDQVAHDLEIIQRAADQRLSSSTGSVSGVEPSNVNFSMLNTLTKADNLAWEYLQPAIENELIPDTTVVTYFQKSAAIRIIPYAPVALIAIPYTCIMIDRDYLATSHEIGHYVYRHGKYRGRPIPTALGDRIADCPSWVREWGEEIFADVYGCLVGGAVIALDFQELELESSSEEFTTDDGAHPTSILRPLIHTKVLKNKGDAQSAQTLHSYWEKRRKQRYNGDQFLLSNGDRFVINDAISPEVELDINKPVDKVINEVLNLLSGVSLKSSGNRFESRRGKEAPLNQPELIEQLLYEDFKTELKDTLVKFKGPELEEGPDKIDEPGLSRLKITSSNDSFRIGETKLWMDLIKANRRNLVGLPPEIWVPLLSVDGWTTKGPRTHI